MSVTPASEWKKANRKIITLPSGRTVEIRKLTVQFLITSGDTLGFAAIEDVPGPGSNLTPEQAVAAARKLEQAVKAADTPDRRRRRIDHIVQEAVIRPKVVSPEVEPKEDELHPADFGPDLGALLESITDMNPELFKLPFRPEAVSPDAPRGGGDLRSPAESAPPGIAGGPADGSGSAPAGTESGSGVVATPAVA